MGCTPHGSDARRAREFALAAAHVASEAVLLMQKLDEETPPTPAACRALAHAAEAVEALERLAKEGDPLDLAYQTAAWSLQAVAVVLAELRARPPAGSAEAGGAHGLAVSDGVTSAAY